MFETKIYVANKKGLFICNFDNINKITVFFGKKKAKKLQFDVISSLDNHCFFIL